jgi:hypothetical protein
VLFLLVFSTENVEQKTMFIDASLKDNKTTEDSNEDATVMRQNNSEQRGQGTN